MEKDSKIIAFKEGKAGAPPRSVETPAREVKELLFQLEEKLERSLESLEVTRQEDRERFHHDLHILMKAFEEKINARLLDLKQTERKAVFETTGHVLKTADRLGKAVRKLISVPDFEFLKRSEEVDEFGLDPEFEKQLRPIMEFLHDRYWRVETHGLNHIPNEGRALLVSNHSGTLPWDGAMIKFAILKSHPAQRSVRFLVENFVYHFPFLGMNMARVGGVRACPENADRLLKRDHLVAVFPEGVKGLGKLYRNRYQLQRFGRGGVIRLALKTRTPIIPTAVVGAEEIYPLIARSTFLARPLGVPYVPITPFFPWLGPLGLIPLPSKWSIHFGQPIDLATYGPEAADDPLLVSRLNEEVRAIIQEMIKDGLTKRLSIWFG